MCPPEGATSAPLVAVGGGAVRRPLPPAAAVEINPGSETESTSWKFDEPGVDAAGLVDPELLD